MTDRRFRKPPADVTQDEAVAMQRAVAAGASIRAVARSMHRSPATVWRVVRAGSAWRPHVSPATSEKRRESVSIASTSRQD
jgi:IS30 family transposase